MPGTLPTGWQAPVPAPQRFFRSTSGWRIPVSSGLGLRVLAQVVGHLLADLIARQAPRLVKNQFTSGMGEQVRGGPCGDLTATPARSAAVQLGGLLAGSSARAAEMGRH